jgi:PAS domain S-box-containing protein
LVEVIGRPIPEFGVDYLLLSIRDVTERRRFEVAWDDPKFRSLVQTAASVLVHVTRDGIVGSVSVSVTRMFGHDPEVVGGQPFASLFHPHDRESIRALLEAAPSQEGASGPLTVEARCLRANRDDFVPVELAIVSLVDDPTVNGFVVSMHDVSDRAAARQECSGPSLCWRRRSNRPQTEFWSSTIVVTSFSTTAFRRAVGDTGPHVEQRNRDLDLCRESVGRTGGLPF